VQWNDSDSHCGDAARLVGALSLTRVAAISNGDSGAAFNQPLRPGGNPGLLF